LSESLPLPHGSTLSRRRLLQAAGVGALGLGLGQLAPLPRVDESLRLDGIDGRIVGDDFSLGHRWRDGKLAHQPAKDAKVGQVGVLIVGGGVAGLTSAWRLQRSGYRDFQLLERSHYLGGIAHAGQAGEHRFPWGAHYVDPPGRGNKGLCKLYEDCKVILGYHPQDKRPLCDPRYIVKPPHRNILAGGRWTRGLMPWHMASPRERRVIKDFVAEMEYCAALRGMDGRRAFTFPIDASSRDDALRRLDGITMKTYMDQRRMRSPLLDWLVNDRCIDEFSLPFDRISAWAGIQYFASVAPLKPLPPPPGFPHDPRIDAVEAKRLGLVSEVYPDEDFAAGVQALAAKLATRPVGAMSKAKELLRSSWQVDLETRLTQEQNAIAEQAAGPEGQEGVAAFLEKREPDYLKG